MKILVIGGGAAGILAAIAAKETNPSAQVDLLEKNDKQRRSHPFSNG